MRFPSETLTHWSRATHICVSKLTIIGSDNGLLPSQRQAIIWTYAGILLIRPWGTNFSEVLIENWCIFVPENAFENAVCEMSAILSRPQCVNKYSQLPVLSLHTWVQSMDTPDSSGYKITVLYKVMKLPITSNLAYLVSMVYLEHAAFFLKKCTIYLQFLSFLNTDMSQLFEICLFSTKPLPETI